MSSRIRVFPMPLGPWRIANCQRLGKSIEWSNRPSSPSKSARISRIRGTLAPRGKGCWGLLRPVALHLLVFGRQPVALRTHIRQ